jgi:hypothetical protein
MSGGLNSPTETEATIGVNMTGEKIDILKKSVQIIDTPSAPRRISKRYLDV